MITSDFITQYDRFITYCILKYACPPIDDFKQDIYLKLCEKPFHTRDTKAYISNIVRNYFVDMYRHNNHRIEYFDNKVTNSGIERLIYKDVNKFLNDQHDECLRLYAIGYHYREIAKILKLSMSGVKMRIYRLRKKLHGKAV